MSLKECVVHELDALNDAQLAALYAEFADEDRELAEEGIEDYARVLAAEDVKEIVQ